MIDKILELATQLPTGLDDQAALEKYNREHTELNEALAAGDEIGATLEAGDCVYYAIKACANYLISPGDRHIFIQQVAYLVGLTVNQVLQVCITKYSLRARSGYKKDDVTERAAVEELIKEF